MQKIITFLGKSSKETRYCWQGKLYTGRVFAEVLKITHPFDEMLVLVTAQAGTTTWPILEAYHDPRISRIDIPNGESVEEMWEIFNRILEHVHYNDRVVFDITHGLRSIPFLTFLFAAFLKTARGVTIESVLYGGMELGDIDKPAPVIDLSDFVSMIDWLIATDQFVQTGDSRRLATLINLGGNKDPKLSKTIENLTDISQALILAQPFSLMKSASSLSMNLDSAASFLSAKAPPFPILTEQILNAYEPLALKSGTDFERVKTELHQVFWYFQTNQLIQAFSLTREWLIDAITYRLNKPLNFTRTARKEMEQTISGLVMVGQKRTDPDTGNKREFSIEDLNEAGREIYETWDERDQLIELWNTFSNARNALDHCEHQSDTMKVKTIQQKAKKTVELLHNLARKWEFENSES